MVRGRSAFSCSSGGEVRIFLTASGCILSCFVIKTLFFLFFFTNIAVKRQNKKNINSQVPMGGLPMVAHMGQYSTKSM